MLNLEKMVAVSGKTGIFCLVGNRKDGLILEEYDSGKRFLAASRAHQFTPLEGVSIYTEEDALPLATLFGNMKALLAETPLVDDKAESAVIKEYFAVVMPDYDRERVQVSDMRKVIKWFAFLNSRDLLVETEETPETAPETEEEEAISETPEAEAPASETPAAEEPDSEEKA